MKKICFITTVSLTLKSFVVETAKYLYNTGEYDITLICNDDEKFRESLPEYLRFIPVSMARGIDASVISSIFDFIKIFKREKFDLVQFATPNASLAASIAAKICRVPVRLYCQWGIRYVGFSGTPRKIFKLIEKFVCSNATHVNAVSPLNKKFAVEEGLYRESKATVLGRGGTIGVDIAQYDISKKAERRAATRESCSIPEDSFVFGFAGRVSADKGCNELFTAFKKLSETRKDVILLIAGPVEDDCGIETPLLNWAKESLQVVMTGQIENALMCNYYSAMDALIHPTYREGFGMVIQEAGAMACPVITTQIPGASEVLEDGKSCLLIKPADADSLYEKMALMCSDPTAAAQMGQNARAFVEEHYERSIMLKNQLERYNNLLEE